jgi:hypothetical protein
MESRSPFRLNNRVFYHVGRLGYDIDEMAALLLMLPADFLETYGVKPGPRLRLVK